MLPNPAHRRKLCDLLVEGWGVQDIAVMTGFSEFDIRGEIRAMRKIGELARLYESVRAKWAREAQGCQ